MGDMHPVLLFSMALSSFIIAICPLLIYLLLQKQVSPILQRIEKHLAALHQVGINVENRSSQKPQ